MTLKYPHDRRKGFVLLSVYKKGKERVLVPYMPRFEERFYWFRYQWNRAILLWRWYRS